MNFEKSSSNNITKRADLFSSRNDNMDRTLGTPPYRSNHLFHQHKKLYNEESPRYPKLSERLLMPLMVLFLLDLQKRLKDSLERTWKNSLSHDWIPVEKAKTFPLREFYVGLRWVRVMKRAIKNFQQELASIYDIFDIEDTDDKLKATNILVTGKKKPF